MLKLKRPKLFKDKKKFFFSSISLVIAAYTGAVLASNKPPAVVAPVEPVVAVQTQAPIPTPTPAQTAQVNRTPKLVPGCTTTIIPYKWTSQNDPTLVSPQTRTTPGLSGAHYFCPVTANSPGMDDTVPPIDAVTYVGTKQPAPVPLEPYNAPAPSGHSASSCQVIAAHGSGDSSAYDYCVQTATGP